MAGGNRDGSKNRKRLKWDPEFKRHRKIAETENTPWIEGRGNALKTPRPKAKSQSKKAIGEELDEEESDASKFMHSPNEGDVCRPRVDKVDSFCAQGTVDFLKSKEWSGQEVVKSESIVLERTLEVGNVRSIKKTKPLNAQQLYRELREPRFRAGGPHLVAPIVTNSGLQASGRQVQTTTTTAARNSGEPSPPTSPTSPASPSEDRNPYQLEPDVDCRLIFISDPDRWSYLALIGTASYLQTPPLRELLYKYLKFEPSFGVAIPPKGFQTFRLEFHLPYFAWRSRSLSEDPRALRKHYDLSFFDCAGGKPSGFLYEAQISCTITGSDEWTWCGYCLIDNYFDQVDDGKETASQYYDDGQQIEGIYADPFTYGASDTGVPIADPREYFLEVLTSRTQQVQREWQQVVEMLEENITESQPHYKPPWLLLNERATLKEAREYKEKKPKIYNWITHAIETSTKLSRVLSELVKAWHQFCDRYETIFRGLPDNGDSWLETINTTFQEMEALQDKLESLKQECEAREKSFQSFLEYEGRTEGNHLLQLAMNNKSLQVTTTLGFPVVMASTILSMNESASFMPLTPKSFVILILAATALGVVVHVYHSYPCWEILIEIIRYIQLKLKTEGPSLQAPSPGSESPAEPRIPRVRRDVEDSAALTPVASSIRATNKVRLSKHDCDSQGSLPSSFYHDAAPQLPPPQPVYSPSRSTAHGPE